MGYLEGYSSWKQIVDFYPNYYQSKHPINHVLLFIHLSLCISMYSYYGDINTYYFNTIPFGNHEHSLTNLVYSDFPVGIFDTKSPVLCNPDMRILRYLQENYDFMLSNSLKHYETSEYWLVVRGILVQLDGLLAGFKEGQREGVRGGGGDTSERRGLHVEDVGKESSKKKNSDNKKTEEKEEKEETLAALELTTIDAPSLMHFLVSGMC